MFGRRRRQATAAREAERTALFARLAERPDHICPFLGLSSERTAFLDGVSDEHRCFASVEPAPLSAEQQTRVCQQRGYGNCPRYLRGVLVIPTDELDALRRPTPAVVPAAPRPRPARREPGRLSSLLLAVLVLMIFGIAGTSATYLVMTVDGPLIGGSGEPTPSPTPSPRPSRTPAPTATPTPDPTPVAGDVFAYYEVSVERGTNTLFRGTDELVVDFNDSSFARVEPRDGPDGEAEWVTLDGDLVGWAYRAPESGDFRIRAVFLDGSGSRSSYDLDDEAVRTVPEATPAPAP